MKRKRQNPDQMEGEDTGSIGGAALSFPGSLWQPANPRAVISLCADFLKDDCVGGPAPAYPGVYNRAQDISLSVHVR